MRESTRRCKKDKKARWALDEMILLREKGRGNRIKIKISIVSNPPD